MKITYQTPAAALQRAITDGIGSDSLNGGHQYDFAAMLALKARHEVLADPDCVRPAGMGLARHVRRVAWHGGAGDVVIRDPTMIALGGLSPDARQIGIVHHLEEHLAATSLKYRLYFHRLRARLRQMDTIVCVSRFWQARLAALGCRDVRVIYNAFDLLEFEFGQAEIQSFRKRHNLDAERPLVCIGNARPGKGADIALEALRGLQVQVVATAVAPQDDSLQVRRLALDRRDYLLLLKVSDVVVTASTMPEGWNRTAHEAMLCATPVVGSGSGGMAELLTEGGQIMAGTPQAVRAAVTDLLTNPGARGEIGRRYVRQFDKAYFSNAWLALLDEPAAARRKGK